MISVKINQLRIRYEAECATLKRTYDKSLSSLETELARVRAVDYSKPYRDRYNGFCNAMEELYQKILKVESGIHGLDFYTDKYIQTATVLPFENKNVEEMFEHVIIRCRENAKALEESHTVTEYANLLRAFCNLLATMRYIVKHSSELLAKSGFPARDKKCEEDKVLKLIDELKCQYKKDTKLENLKCYEDIVALYHELMSIYARSISERLGAVALGDDGQYRYLIGYRVEKISKEDTDFAENILGVSREKIGREPIYLEACSNRCNLIINAPNDFLTSKECYELVKNIYFSFASRVDKNMLQFGCIECTRNRAVVRSIYTGIDTSATKKLLGGDGNFCYKDININDAAKVSQCINKINSDCIEVLDNFENIKEYNLKTEKNKEPLRMVAVNLYPAGFIEANRSEQPYSELQRIMGEFSDSGILFVVCQDTSNPTLKQNGVRIDAERCNAVEITLTDKNYNEWKASGKPLSQCEFVIDGKSAVMDITTPEFDSEAYWETLKRFYSQKKVFALREVFKKIDIAAEKSGKPASIFEDGAIEIPLGLKGSSEYSLRYPLSKPCHTLVYGGSGSGKSSFLHTFIMSLCYKYSAEEIQIYLADFKLNLLSFYSNHLLPHIKYILMRNGITEVKDTFNMIERIRQERQDTIRRYGCEDIEQYNRKIKQNPDEKMKKLPMLFFIIDEYQVIDSVTKGHARDLEEIKQKIATIFSQARSAGIGLFLCGQNISGIDDFDTGNIQTYIVMGKQTDNDRYIRKYFLNDDYGSALDNVKDFLSIEQEGRCLIKSAGNSVADKVRIAFSGGEADGSKEGYVSSILSLPRKENQKRLSAILGGSEDPARVTDDSDYHEHTMYDKATSYNFPLGIGSTLGLPTYVDFASEGNNFGWLISSKKSESVFNITRSIMLSFLYKTACFGYDYDQQSFSKRIHYWGDMYSYKKIIGSEFIDGDNLALVDSQVNMYSIKTNTYKIFEDILDLRDEMDRRLGEMDENGVRFSKTPEYPPYLVVIQSLKWLTKDNIEKVLKKHDSDAARNQKEAAAKPATIDNESLNVANASNLNPALFSMVFAAKSKPVTPVEEKERDITPDMVINALSELYAAGNTCGIFLLISADEKDMVERVLGSKGYSGGEYWNNAIYGTFSEYADSDEDPEGEESSDMICYVGKSGIKTRIYDYSPTTEDEWWESLKSIYEEKY